MDVTGIEAIGYAGTAATIASYSMRRILPLRIAAVVSSFCFIAYSATLGLWPLLLTELVILPINSLRLFELLRDRRRAVKSAG